MHQYFCTGIKRNLNFEQAYFGYIMRHQRIIFLVTVFIVVASAVAADPAQPEVKCTAVEMLVTTSDFETYKTVVYKLGSGLSKPLLMESGMTTGSGPTAKRTVSIPGTELAKSGNIFETSLSLTAAVPNTNDKVVMTNKKKFKVTCDFSGSGIGKVSQTLDAYVEESITGISATLGMELSPDLKIGEKSDLTISLPGHKCATIISCDIRPKDSIDEASKFEIHNHCSPDPGFVKPELFDSSLAHIKAKVTGIGLPDTNEVAISCEVAGSTIQTECDTTIKTRIECPSP